MNKSALSRPSSVVSDPGLPSAVRRPPSENEGYDLVLAGERSLDQVNFDRQVVDFFVSAADLLGVPKSVAAIYAIVFAGLWLAETPPLVTISSGILIVGAIFVRQLLANKDIRRVDAAIALELRRLRKNTRCSSPLANAVAH